MRSRRSGVAGRLVLAAPRGACARACRDAVASPPGRRPAPAAGRRAGAGHRADAWRTRPPARRGSRRASGGRALRRGGAILGQSSARRGRWKDVRLAAMRTRRRVVLILKDLSDDVPVATACRAGASGVLSRRATRMLQARRLCGAIMTGRCGRPRPWRRASAPRRPAHRRPAAGSRPATAGPPAKRVDGPAAEDHRRREQRQDDHRDQQAAAAAAQGQRRAGAADEGEGEAADRARRRRSSAPSAGGAPSAMAAIGGGEARGAPVATHCARHFTAATSLQRQRAQRQQVQRAVLEVALEQALQRQQARPAPAPPRRRPGAIGASAPGVGPGARAAQAWRRRRRSPAPAAARRRRPRPAPARAGRSGASAFIARQLEAARGDRQGIVHRGQDQAAAGQVRGHQLAEQAPGGPRPAAPAARPAATAPAGLAISRASARRRRWPAESLRTSRSSSRVRSSVSAAAARRRAIAAGPAGLEAQLLARGARGLQPVLVAEQVHAAPRGRRPARAAPTSPAKRDPPGGRADEAGDGAHEAGLAGPVGARSAPPPRRPPGRGQGREQRRSPRAHGQVFDAQRRRSSQPRRRPAAHGREPTRGLRDARPRRDDAARGERCVSGMRRGGRCVSGHQRAIPEPIFGRP